MRALKRVAETEQTLLVMLSMVPRLLRDADWRRRSPDEGAGLGVLLVPGFGFGDRSLALAAAWLRARGYRPAPARIGFNVGCTSELVDRIERRLEEHADLTGRRVVLLGQSRGGWLGRLAAVRRPDLVRGLVTLGSPVLNPLGATSGVVRVARALARLSALGVPGLLDDDCFTGSCYETNVALLAAELPPSVPALAVYSRLDRVAPWHLCQDPSAECVEIRSSHTAMGLHPDFYRVLRPRLASWATEDDRVPSLV
ncbi:alpha/beta fold hydrolase [Actinosynnema sp. CS-041913]|uniref:alpha/beta fold hydrolase n=1 Tax=Actinosynnema sp. CS-041913 TaxID=3239917 RepID=UPI003D89DA84